MDIFQLSDECVTRMAALRPISATYQGIPGHDGEWGDLGPEGARAVEAALREYQQRLAALPPPQERWARLAVLVMDDLLRRDLGVFEHQDHLRDLNSIDSTFQNMRRVFDVMDVQSAAGWENVISRLRGLDRACLDYRTLLEAGRIRGLAVARRQVRAALEQGRVQTGGESFFLTLPGVLKASGVSTTALEKDLGQAVPQAMLAIAGLVDYLEKEYLPHAPERDAVGRDRYLRHARRFLGMDIDPLETYAWGWTQVAFIASRMQALAPEIQPGTPLPEVVAMLKTDVDRAAPSQEAFVEIMRSRQQQALAELDGEHFDIPDPVRRIEIKLAPPGGSLGAYYIPPSEDFSRPGTVWYSLGEKQQVPLWDQVSTAYHEGFPGHHLQCGIQVSLTERLSRLHRLMDIYSGYAEGWALYTEHLMADLGYYEKPEYLLGMLACQMMRACRIVIDIGCHLELSIPEDQPFHPGETWGYDLGVEMLESLAGLPDDHARSEMTRYLGWPGQAISYKVGERIIMQLRDELRNQHGEKFTLKDFHARVVGSGPLALELLRDVVLQ